MMINKNYFIGLLVLVTASGIYAEDDLYRPDLSKISDKRSKLEGAAQALYEKVQLGGPKKAEKIFDQDDFKSEEKLALFRLAAQKAQINGDTITRDLLTDQHNDLKNKPSWVRRMGGPIGTFARWGFSPIKKGFDGACYAVGGVTGVGLMFTIPGLLIISQAIKKYQEHNN